MKKRGKPITHSRYMLISLIVIVVILLYFLLIQTHAIENPFIEIAKDDFEVNSTDRCSLIAGQLIHTIKDEDECRNICFSECEVRGASLEDFTFEERLNNCNACTCYCG